MQEIIRQEPISEANVKLLVAIQQELKAPKEQFNSFGKYSYRSAEDILEAAKPVAHKYNCAVSCTDTVVSVGNRFYVLTAASLMFPNGECFFTTGCAREEDTKKGMDGSQITGAASSYARKYALNGLFAIDDSKDSDGTNDHGKGESQQKPQSKPAAKTAPKDQPTVLQLKQKEFGEKCRAYRKDDASKKKPLEGLLFDKLKENGLTDIKSLSGCTNEILFSELIDIIDIELASAK